MSYFTLANDNNGNLLFWRDVILERKKQVDARDDNLTARDGQMGVKRRKVIVDLDDSSDPDYQHTESEDSHLEYSEYEGPVRKKARTFSSSTTQNPSPRSGKSKAGAGPTRLIAPSPPPSMLGPITPQSTSVSASAPSSSNTPPTTTSTTPHQPRPGAGAEFVKSEPLENDSIEDTDQDQEMIDIFIGPTNTKFPISRTNLLQSPVLSSRITTRHNTIQTTNHQNQTQRGSTGASFIMDPTFSTIDPKKFTAIVEFLNNSEYEPLLLRDPDSKDEEGKYVLDDSRAPINYENELIRSAELINLGRRLGLPRFAELVFRKILLGYPGGRYGIKAFLSFAKIVLGQQDQGVGFECGFGVEENEDAGPAAEEGQGEVAEGGTGQEAKKQIWQEIQDWTVKFLAENMEIITASRDRRDVQAFWGVLRLKLQTHQGKKETGEGDDKGEKDDEGEGKAEVVTVMVEQRVLEQRLEMGRKWPGGRVKVEDD